MRLVIARLRKIFMIYLTNTIIHLRLTMRKTNALMQLRIAMELKQAELLVEQEELRKAVNIIIFFFLSEYDFNLGSRFALWIDFDE